MAAPTAGLETFPFSVRRWTAQRGSVQSVVTNPFTRRVRVVDWGSESLVVAVELPPQSQETGPRLSAWIAARGGSTVRFRVRPPHWLVHKRSPGVPVVDGAAQSGRTLNVRGLKAKMAAALQAGKYVSAGDRLYLVTADADSDAAGEAAVGVFPAVSGGDLDDGDAVEWREPTGVFRLAEPAYEEDWRDDGLLEAVGLRFIEAR
jgi:hypothetical protein